MLLVTSVAGACGTSGGNGNATGTGTVRPSASATASSSPTASTVPSPGGSSPSGHARTVTGRVAEGVEPRCTLLRAAGLTYLLQGDLPPREQLRPGSRWTMQGRVLRNAVSYCQQGTPFFVDEATPLGPSPTG